MRRRITMRRELKGTDEEMNNDEEEVGALGGVGGGRE